MIKYLQTALDFSAGQEKAVPMLIELGGADLMFKRSGEIMEDVIENLRVRQSIGKCILTTGSLYIGSGSWCH